jgi:hypothetical protein
VVLIVRDKLPKWKGKRITRTITEWTLREPAKHNAGRAHGRSTGPRRIFSVALLAVGGGSIRSSREF